MKQIITFGGGGFSMDDNPLLDEYVLAHSRSDSPKVCFVPTASGDSEGYIESFYQAFSAFPCVRSHLSLSEPFVDHLEAFVLAQDVIYVGGGDTTLLLAEWRESGLDVILRKAWESGVVLAGLSAGSLCWFEEGVTDTQTSANEYTFSRIQGLGLIAGSHCPHYDSDEGFKSSYLELVRNGQLKDGIATQDGVALHYIGSELQHVVSSRPQALAFHVKKVERMVVEEAMSPHYLGGERG